MFHENVQVFNTDSLTKCCALLLRFAASASGLYYLWMVSLFFGEIRGISECLDVLAKVLAKGKLSSAYFEGQDSRSDVYLVFSVYFFRFIDKFGRRFHLSTWCESSKELLITICDSSSTRILFEFNFRRHRVIVRQDLEVRQQQDRVVPLEVVEELIESCKEWNQVSCN